MRGGNGNDRMKGRCGNDLVVDYDQAEVLILKGYCFSFLELAITETDEGTLSMSKEAAASSSTAPSTSARIASS